MSLPRTPLYIAGILISFVGMAALVIYLSRSGIITPEVGALMLIALVGIYFGSIILIAMFRLVLRLK